MGTLPQRETIEEFRRRRQKECDQLRLIHEKQREEKNVEDIIEDSIEAEAYALKKLTKIQERLKNTEIKLER